MYIFPFCGKISIFLKLSYVCIYFFLPEKLDFLKNERVILRFWYMLEALVFFFFFNKLKRMNYNFFLKEKKYKTNT